MSEHAFIADRRRRLELRLRQVRGRRQQRAREALASLLALGALMQDPAVARAVLLAIEIDDALPRSKARGRDITKNLPAIAGKSSCKAPTRAGTVGPPKREVHP